MPFESWPYEAWPDTSVLSNGQGRFVEQRDGWCSKSITAIHHRNFLDRGIAVYAQGIFDEWRGAGKAPFMRINGFKRKAKSYRRCCGQNYRDCRYTSVPEWVHERIDCTFFTIKRVCQRTGGRISVPQGLFRRIRKGAFRNVFCSSARNV